MGASSFDRSAGSGRRWWLLGGGCLAVFACLCIAAIAAVLLAPENLVVQAKQLLGLSTESQAVEYVPANAAMFMVVNPNFTQLAGAVRLQAILNNNPTVRQKWDELSKTSTSDSDFSFDRDVQPWLGTEIAVAVFDFSTLSQTSPPSNPEFVVLASTRDKAKSDEALARIRKSGEGKGTTYGEETYKGTTIVIGKSKAREGLPESTTAYTTIQGQVLFAGSLDAIKKAIDTKQAGDQQSLKRSGQYLAVLDTLPKDRAASVYLDAQSLFKQAAATARTPGVEALEALRGVGLSIGFTDAGIRIDYTTIYDKSKAPEAVRRILSGSKASGDKVLDLLPSSALLALTGQEFSAIWQGIVDSQKDDRQFQQGLKDIKTQTGIDVSEDLFEWMTGEIALSAVPAKPLSAISPDAPAAGLLLMIETPDQALAKSKLEKVAQALAQQGVVFSTKKVNGVDMQVVQGLELQGVTVGYGFLDNYVVIGSSEEVLSAAVDGKKSPLAKDAEFQKTVKPLPQPHTGVLYISLAKVIELVRPLLSKSDLITFQKDVEPLLKPFKAISAAASVPKDGTQSGTWFIYVADQ